MLRRSLIPVLIAIFVAALVSAASRAEVLSTLSIDDVTVTEGASPNAVFTVALDELSGTDVTFDYTTFDDTATAGEDYTAASGQLTDSGRAASRRRSGPITNDALNELDENYTVTLSEVVGGGVGDDVGVGNHRR